MARGLKPTAPTALVGSIRAAAATMLLIKQGLWAHVSAPLYSKYASPTKQAGDIVLSVVNPKPEVGQAGMESAQRPLGVADVHRCFPSLEGPIQVPDGQSQHCVDGGGGPDRFCYP